MFLTNYLTLQNFPFFFVSVYGFHHQLHPHSSKTVLAIGSAAFRKEERQFCSAYGNSLNCTSTKYIINLIHELLLLALLIRRYHKYIHNLILQFHSTLVFPQRDYGSPFPWHMQTPRCPKPFSLCLDPFLSPTPISLSTYKICVSALMSLVDWDYYTK